MAYNLNFSFKVCYYNLTHYILSIFAFSNSNTRKFSFCFKISNYYLQNQLKHFKDYHSFSINIVVVSFLVGLIKLVNFIKNNSIKIKSFRELGMAQ